MGLHTWAVRVPLPQAALQEGQGCPAGPPLPRFPGATLTLKPPTCKIEDLSQRAPAIPHAWSFGFRAPERGARCAGGPQRPWSVSRHYSLQWPHFLGLPSRWPGTPDPVTRTVQPPSPLPLQPAGGRPLRVHCGLTAGSLRVAGWALGPRLRARPPGGALGAAGWWEPQMRAEAASSSLQRSEKTCASASPPHPRPFQNPDGHPSLWMSGTAREPLTAQGAPGQSWALASPEAATPGQHTEGLISSL